MVFCFFFFLSVFKNLSIQPCPSVGTFFRQDFYMWMGRWTHALRFHLPDVMHREDFQVEFFASEKRREKRKERLKLHTGTKPPVAQVRP